MKKVFILIFTFFYLLPAIGLSVNIHWCGNKIGGVSVGIKLKDSCVCGKKVRKGCCKESHAFVKLSDNQKVATSLTLNAPVRELSEHLFSIVLSNPSSLNKLFLPTNHAPPPWNKQNVYLSIGAFRV